MCRVLEGEIMREVPSVKSQFRMFVDEVLDHKQRKNADCTGGEAVHDKVVGFKLFLDRDRSTRAKEIAPLVEEMKVVERGKPFELEKLEAKMKTIVNERNARQKKGYWDVC